MARPLAAGAAALLCLRLAASASISSCGAPTDHLSAVQIALAPDPLAKGKPFTLTVEGTLDEDHVGGSADVNLQVKALGIIHKTIAKTANYTIAPGVVKGAVKLAVGPVTLPTELPGEVSLAGKVQIKNTKGEPVACLSLNLQVPVMKEGGKAAEVGIPAAVPLTGASCAKPSDHLTNVRTSTSGGVTTATATLDEDLAAAKVHVDITIRELFLKVPLKLDVPITWSPALAKGDWKATSSVSSALADEQERRLGVTATGQIVVDDGEDTEVTCIAVDSRKEELAVVV